MSREAEQDAWQAVSYGSIGVRGVRGRPTGRRDKRTTKRILPAAVMRSRSTIPSRPLTCRVVSAATLLRRARRVEIEVTGGGSAARHRSSNSIRSADERGTLRFRRGPAASDERGDSLWSDMSSPGKGSPTSAPVTGEVQRCKPTREVARRVADPRPASRRGSQV